MHHRRHDLGELTRLRSFRLDDKRRDGTWDIGSYSTGHGNSDVCFQTGKCNKRDENVEFQRFLLIKQSWAWLLGSIKGQGFNPWPEQISGKIMKPIESAEDISVLAFGFMASKALFAALHVDVFGALADGPKLIDDLAAATKVPVTRMETLVTALVAVGLLTRDGKTIANGPASSQYLVRDGANYFGDYLRFQINRQIYPFMEHLDGVLLGKTDAVEFPTYADWMADKDQAEMFSRSQHSGSLGPGAVLAKRLALSADATSMLDVGGGSGAFSIMFCKRYPELRATVLDFPNVIEVGKRFVAEEGLQEKVGFIAADGTSANWPEDQDVVLMSYLFSGVPEEAIPGLCAEAYRVLKPGGHVAVHDFMVSDDRSGPPLAALWQLQHMVFTPDGVGLTPGFVHEALTAAGFEVEQCRDLISGMTQAMIAHKPA
jgi:2-hydroxy-4-(methylsulfanyl)butanoate S-methyltransferase